MRKIKYSNFSTVIKIGNWNSIKIYLKNSIKNKKDVNENSIDIDFWIC